MVVMVMVGAFQVWWQWCSGMVVPGLGLAGHQLRRLLVTGWPACVWMIQRGVPVMMAARIWWGLSAVGSRRGLPMRCPSWWS